MMLRTRGIAAVLEKGIAIAFDNGPAPGGDAQRKIVREALALYGINSRQVSPEARQRFINDRTDCLVALMMAEADMEIEDHISVTSGTETGTAVLQDHYPLYQWGMYLGRIVNNGDNVLASMHNFLLDLQVVKSILQVSITDKVRGKRMFLSWLAFSAGRDMRKLAQTKGNIVESKIDGFILVYKNLLDRLTTEAVVYLKKLPVTPDAAAGALNFGSQATTNLGYPTDWQHAVRVAYKYECLSDALKRAVNEFILGKYTDLSA